MNEELADAQEQLEQERQRSQKYFEENSGLKSQVNYYEKGLLTSMLKLKSIVKI